MKAPTLPRERPLLYSGAMVRAILAGEKTQTRRVLKGEWSLEGDESGCGWEPPRCPHGLPGDRLWVRETWAKRADGMVAWKAGPHPFDVKHELCRWRPSIHMPRWASRITLDITGVRVERVQAISDADIRAEGVAEYARSKGLDPARLNLRAAWIDLWDSINGERCGGRFACDRNPWTWVVEFRRAEGGAP